MALPRHFVVFILQLIFVPLAFSLFNAQGLKHGFYRKTCPNVDEIVRKTTAKYISKAPTLAAPLLRMHFHDCVVRVCFIFYSFSYKYFLYYHYCYCCCYIILSSC